MKKSILLLLLLGLFNSSFAHVVVQELENMSKVNAAATYLMIGYKHILPLGLDHILFVIGLFILMPRLKPILVQSTVFTVAHSITLGLSAYGIIPQFKFVEPLIAISLIYIAFENIFSPKMKPIRMGIIFMFGLIHGMGFAGALGQIGLPQNAFMISLIMFNLGVELGQVTVILLTYLFLTKWYSSKAYYQSKIVVPISAAIAIIAFYWTIQRLLL